MYKRANGKAKTLQLVQLQQLQFFQQQHQQQKQDKQLAKYLAFSQQLPNNNSQQLTFQKNNFQEKTFNNEFAKNLEIEKDSLEKTFYHQLSEGIPREELTGQSSLLGSLMHKHPFTAFRELVEKNFYKKKLEHNSFTQTEAGACKEQLLPTCSPEASLSQQLFSSSLVQQRLAKAAFQQELSPANSQRASGRKALSQEELREPQLADQTACKPELQQDSFSESSFRKRTFQSTASRHFALAAWKRTASPRTP